MSPDGRRALLLGNQGSIFCVDLSVRRTEKPRQWHLRFVMVVSMIMILVISLVVGTGVGE